MPTNSEKEISFEPADCDPNKFMQQVENASINSGEGLDVIDLKNGNLPTKVKLLRGQAVILGSGPSATVPTAIDPDMVEGYWYYISLNEALKNRRAWEKEQIELAIKNSGNRKP